MRRFQQFLVGAGALAMLLVPQRAAAHGDLELRIATLTRQIQSATNDAARLYLERGELQREHLKFEAAAADYDTAARLDPNLTPVHFCRARVLVDTGKLEPALAAYDQALAREPGNGLGRIERARVLMKLGNRSKAIAEYRSGVEILARPQPEAITELARALDAEGQPGEALAALDQGISKLGPLPALQELAVELELRKPDYTAALTRLDTLIERSLRKERWLARRGEILLAARKPGEARHEFEKALAAIEALPAPLQKTPPTQALHSQIQRTLDTLTQAPAVKNELSNHQ